MEIIKGGVTAPSGFMASSAEAGIKYRDREDMALVFSKVKCTAAGVFTTNKTKAAPVLWDKQALEEAESARGVLVNSGIANACTGKEGMEICREMAEEAARALKTEEKEILICSTGVIGMQLPMDRIRKGIEKLVPALEPTAEAGERAARAIMTTDTHPKQLAVSFELGGKKAVIGAMCKGSGMIAPNMCTMLCFITTDAAIEKSLLQKALSETAADTFNMVSVDGDTSTNDTVLLLASGEAKNPAITEENQDYETFREALFLVCRELSRQIAADGEGATKLVTVKVLGARSKTDARTLARSVASSSLVKAAMYGADANWGRIICALGYAGVDFDPEKVKLTISSDKGSILLYDTEPAKDIDEEKATVILKEKEIIVEADCRLGEAEATAWGCDLTYDYVKINADYRS